MAFVPGDFRYGMLFRNQVNGGTSVVTGGIQNVGATQAQVSDDLHQAWKQSGGMRDLQVTTMDLGEILVEDLSGALAGQTFLIEEAGLSTGVPVPPQCALTITLNTAVGGRAYRGRQYWPYLDSNYLAVGQSQWDTTAVSANYGNFLAYLDGTHGNSSVAALVSRKRAATSIITHYRTNLYVGTQRRRSDRFE
jgi:hypothetical protein